MEQAEESSDDQSLSTIDGDKAMEMLGNVFSLRRPRDALAGLSSGLKSLAKGALVGIAVLLVGPIVSVATEGIRSLPRSLFGSILAAAIFPLIGTVVGTYQIIRGLLRTPVAVYNLLMGRFWDHQQRAWVSWDPGRALAVPDEQRPQQNSQAGEGNQAGENGGDAPSTNEKEPDFSSDNLFEVLGVSRDTTPDELRRQYYRLARENHPDKQRDDPDAHERFQKLSRAYQVLSNPITREAYCAHGEQAVDERMEVDPSLVFTMLFGSDLFTDYVGELLLATIARLGGGMDMNSIHMQRSQLERVSMLVGKLIER